MLSSDFYAVYQSMGRVEGVDTLWCWAHIHRSFIRAGDARPELAAWTAAWIERIAALYAAHTAITATTTGSAEHTMAIAQSSAALDTLDAQRAAQTSHAQLLHPAAAKVLATLDREGDGLARHREYPELPLDNNTAERALRTPVLGRKNYYGSGSVVSAQLASRVFTITATAERAGLNPLAYLTAYLQECARAGAVRHEPDLEPADNQHPGDLPADGTDGPKPTPRAPTGQPSQRELRTLTSAQGLQQRNGGRAHRRADPETDPLRL